MSFNMKKIIPIFIASLLIVGCKNEKIQVNNNIPSSEVNDDDCYFYWEKDTLSNYEKQAKIDSINAIAEEVKQLIKKGIIHE